MAISTHTGLIDFPGLEDLDFIPPEVGFVEPDPVPAKEEADYSGSSGAHEDFEGPDGSDKPRRSIWAKSAGTARQNPRPSSVAMPRTAGT